MGLRKKRNNMENSVYDGYGKLIGFRCSCCNGIFPKMWGSTCNLCSLRKQELRSIK